MEGVEQTSLKPNGDASLQAQATDAVTQDAENLQGDPPTSLDVVNMIEPQKDVAMCTVAAHSAPESNAEWVPPPVTLELAYPSDEEIVPNPKASFTKAIFPRFRQVYSWFKGSGEHMNSSSPMLQEDTSTSTPCLPITME